MGASSVRKGKAFERWVANALREGLGLSREECKRGVAQSRGGGVEVPDVMLPPELPLHLECKDSEGVSPAAAMRQAVADALRAGGGRFPVAVVKRLRKPPEVYLRALDAGVLFASATAGIALAPLPMTVLARLPDGERHPLEEVLVRVTWADFVALCARWYRAPRVHALAGGA